MATKDLQTLKFKFDHVVFNSLVFAWERNFEVTFRIFLVLVTQKNVLFAWERNFEVTFGIFLVLVTQKNVLESCLDLSHFLLNFSAVIIQIESRKPHQLEKCVPLI